MTVELKVPAVGESVTEAQIGRWLKKEGDPIQKDETLVELETDKVNVELPAPASGRMGKMLKQAGQKAKVGEVIAYIDSISSSSPSSSSQSSASLSAESKPAEATAMKKPTSVSPTNKTAGATEGVGAIGGEIGGKIGGGGHLMPSARRALARQGIDPDRYAAEHAGRITKEDVLAATASATPLPQPPAIVEPDAQASLESDRPEEVVAMTPMRQRIAQRMVQAKQEAALLTTFNEIDMTAMMELRKQHQESFEKRYGIKLGFMSFFVKAAIDALKLYPGINAMIDGENIIYRHYYDIGVAISAPRGLVVPIIRNAQQLSFAEVEQAIADFAVRAKSGKITLEELQGGTFTITNGGIFGSLLSTPIVNPPQSGVLGMHAIQDRPVARSGQVVIRPMMYVALTYDHRIVDGREAVGCLKRIKEAVEDPARILLEI